LRKNSKEKDRRKKLREKESRRKKEELKKRKDVKKNSLDLLNKRQSFNRETLQ
jgi:hypothetical protein